MPSGKLEQWPLGRRCPIKKWPKLRFVSGQTWYESFLDFFFPCQVEGSESGRPAEGFQTSHLELCGEPEPENVEIREMTKPKRTMDKPMIGICWIKFLYRSLKGDFFGTAVTLFFFASAPRSESVGKAFVTVLPEHKEQFKEVGFFTGNQKKRSDFSDSLKKTFTPIFSLKKQKRAL